jgi:hypothetical protein
VSDPRAIPSPAYSTARIASLDEVLTLLDQVADDADALNRRIQDLLTADTPPTP